MTLTGAGALDDARRRARRRLRDGALGAIVLLAVQNLLGIYLNLFVGVTDTTGYAGVFPALFASTAGTLHAVVALLMVVGLGVMIVRARRSGDSRLIWLSWGALASFLVAAYSGYHFVDSSENVYSFAMEVGFLGVVLAEVATLALLTDPSGEDVAQGAAS